MTSGNINKRGVNISVLRIVFSLLSAVLPVGARASDIPTISFKTYASSSDTTETTTFKPGDTFFLKVYIDNTVQTVTTDDGTIDCVGGNPENEEVLKTVTALIRNLNLKAVAEGVKTERQAAFLAKEGCYIMQGFYYYKPMPTQNIERLLSLTGGAPYDSAITDADINRYLDQMEIKHSNAGFQYLMTVISTGFRNPSLLMSISDLYEEASKIHGKNALCVERSIRYSISYCGQTNKEFISRAVDDLKYRRDKA